MLYVKLQWIQIGSAIFAYTKTGDTSRILSSFKPLTPIYAITENIKTYRQLSLCWNVYPKLLSHKDSINELLQCGIQLVKEEGYIKEGDIVVIAGGSPIVNISDDPMNKTIGGVVRI